MNNIDNLINEILGIRKNVYNIDNFYKYTVNIPKGYSVKVTKNDTIVSCSNTEKGITYKLEEGTYQMNIYNTNAEVFLESTIPVTQEMYGTSYVFTSTKEEK